MGGRGATADAVRRCMASVFADRAVFYRVNNGISHREVSMAVVVQKMVDPEVSGVLFTADPMSGKRSVAGVVDQLESGQRIRVDGHRGIVEILDES